MKLISCYISGFGKIAGQSIDFSSPLTSVCAQNGWGKSTLADFIKVMFYGMDTDRKSSKNELSARGRYLPFSLAPYGGSIKFLWQGKEYTIERRFDSKSSAKDELSARCGELPFDFGEKTPGDAIFGVDRESFERTVFTTGLDITLSSTDGILTKLGGVATGEGSEMNESKAIARIEEKMKLYKKRGGGLIEDTRSEISALQDEIRNCDAIKAGLSAKYQELSSLKAREREIGDLLLREQTGKFAAQNWETYQKMLAEAERAAEEIEAIEGSYPIRLPEEAEIISARDTVNTLRENLARAERSAFNARQKARLEYLSNLFASGVPSKEDLSYTQELLQKKQEVLFSAQNVQADTPFERELREKYSSLTSGKKDEIALKYTRLQELHNRCDALQDEIREQPLRRLSGKTKAALISAAALTAAGIGLIFVFLPAGIISLFAGLVVLIFSGFLYLNKKSDGERMLPNPEKYTLRGRIEAEEGELLRMLSPFVPEEETAVLCYHTYLQNLQRYEQLVQRDAEKAKQAEKNRRALDALEEQISARLGKYPLLGESDGEKLYSLRMLTGEYGSLLELRLQGEKEDLALNESIGKSREMLTAFCKEWGIESAELDTGISKMEDDLSRFKSLRAALAKMQADALEFKEKHKVSPVLEREIIDADALKEEQEALSSKIGRLEREIGDDELHDGAEQQIKLADARERLEKYLSDFDALTRARDLISLASNNLRDRYVRPVRDVFKKYSSLLEQALGEKVVIAPDFSLSFEQDGMRRHEGHLSSGQRTVLMLCLRLALIKNMYNEDDLPFLILDDPFTALDSAYLGKVQKVMEELSRDFQIIYLTCHESRKM